ncbi:MAG: adenylate/guanylate cyclase domain-containing protein [Nevskiales bacterium]
MNLDTTPHVIVSLLALGMALAFIIADRRSPTSRALALCLASVGISIAVNMLIFFKHYLAEVPWWSGVFVLPEVVGFIYGYEWLLRVRRTVPSRSLRTSFADNLLRLAQLLALFYGVMSLFLPELRAREFFGVIMNGAPLTRDGLLLFALPLVLSLALAGISGLMLLNRRPDRSETQRLIAFLIGAPFMASGLVLPLNVAPVATAIGLLIFLIGAVQYHVIQGQRAQFMSRFLSPQVAEMVREQGLKSATVEQTLEISVVCCDLRGFTAFSKGTASQKVIQILREYYDAVGAAAAEYGGTIKDQAGDGVLVLVGAPISFADHAQRALDMARRMREYGMRVTRQWSDSELQLGIGVGVASGFATVGVIGGASRLEYTAVGPAVNLACRLCSEATHGEVLVDTRTAELTGEGSAGLKPGQALTLKGYAKPVPSYVLSALAA